MPNSRHLASAENVTSKEGVLMHCHTRAIEIGFENVSIFSAGNAARTPEFQSTYPEVWNAKYLSERYYLVDPVVNEGRALPGPITWGGNYYMEKAQQEGRRMLLEARTFGVRSAFSVPFFSAGGRYTLVTLSSSCKRLDFDRLLLEKEAVAIRIAMQTHFMLAELDLFEAEMNIKLTARQKSCLRMVLNGRTSADMARLLLITEATVRYHLTGAIKTTGAKNATHAAFLAHQLALL